jgi:hypothetical protein
MDKLKIALTERQHPAGTDCVSNLKRLDVFNIEFNQTPFERFQRSLPAGCWRSVAGAPFYR